MFVCGQLAGSVTKAQSHDKGRGGTCNRSAQECKGERNNSVTEGMEMPTSRHRSATVVWLCGLLKSIFGNGKVHCNYKINDQPVREWVTASSK